MDTNKPPYCVPCDGYNWDNRKGYSRVTGENRVPILFVGEGSGRHEVRKGEPFVGAAGQVFDKALRMSGLKRSDYNVTNLIRCGIPNNLLIGQPYERPALDHCRKYLNDVVAERRPKLIVALGEVPLRELAATRISQAEARGYLLDSIYPGVKILPTFHPSRILRGDWHLFGVLLHDLRTAHRFATVGVPEPLPTHYRLTPTAEDIQQYIARLHADPSLPIAYDIETASIIGEDEPDDWANKRIIQIQFSSAAGEALVLPFADHHDAIRAILATPNPKLTWNGRLSDDVALKAQGFPADSYDAMTMWSHLQPGFAGRDASDDEDKGVPARLLNLQAAVSFYFPQEGCWKGTVKAPGPGLGGWLALQYRLRYYGARDADLTWRIGTRLMATLKAQGLWDGWYRYKHQLGQTLTRMSERGLPIDRDAQTELRIHIEEQEQRLDSELQDMIPAHLRPFKQYVGWPKDLREAVKAAGLYVKACQPHQFPEHIVACGYTLMPFEMETDEGEAYLERRLCKVMPFNPRSGKQVLAYIEWQCRRDSRWFIPKHIDTKKPTANKAGVEALIDATGDAALKHIETCKKISKLKDYCGEKWQPAEDGRVHAAFRVGITGTGQTTATNPPIQTYPKHFSKDDKWLEEIGHRIKSIIKAPPGYVMIECLTPDTRVLTADYKWQAIGSLRVGDRLWGFDESLVRKTGSKRPARYLRPAEVVATNRLAKSCLRVTTDLGVVTCSTDHSWLSRQHGKVDWTKADKLKVGGTISFFIQPWEDDNSREAGYLAGFFDGEGHLHRRNVGFGQNPGPTLSRVIDLIRSKGFAVERDGNTETPKYCYLNGKKLLSKCLKYAIKGGQFEWLRFLGSIRPPRLLDKLNLEGMAYWGKKSKSATILEIEHVGEREVVALETTTGTFFAEGLLSHNCDMRGFHARMQAWLAEDAAYYRLANIDTHSFLAAHYVGVPDADTLLELDDAALSKRLKEIKTQYDYERNYLCKRVSFLNQYGGQAEKAATILRLPIMQVQHVLDIGRNIFKPAFKDLPERIDAMLRRHPKLTTAFGFPRYFWDSDPNQAIAFWVASPAHCTIQDAVLRLDERGALERYGACNLMHDSLWWCCPEELAEECVAVAKEELGRPSTVLINSLGPFTCTSDAKWGADMNSLEDTP